VRASFRADEQGPQLSLDVVDLALRPLHAWFDRTACWWTGPAPTSTAASTEGPRVEIPFELDLRARGLDVHNPAIDNRTWRTSPSSCTRGGAGAGHRKLKLESSEVEALGCAWPWTAGPSWGACRAATGACARPRRCACGRILPGCAQPGPRGAGGDEAAGNLGLAVSVGFDAAVWDTCPSTCASIRCVTSPRAGGAGALLPTSAQRRRRRRGARPGAGRDNPDFAPLRKMPAHLPSAFLTARTAVSSTTAASTWR
jgi:hypothetical protein